MALALFKERRLSIRRRLTGMLPGKLIDAHENSLVSRAVDVSEQGLGIISSSDLEIGATVYLLIKDLEIKLTVAWKQRGYAKKDMFRYGLVAGDPLIRIDAIFEECGCME